MVKLIQELGSRKPTINSNYTKKYGLYECDCGNQFEAIIASIKKGNTNSCGCLRKRTTSEQGKRNRKHGLGYSRIYDTWHHMVSRCYNESDKSFSNYGGRGISVYDEWKNSLEIFNEWAINNGYSDDLTIDRINNDGNYEPGNCRFVTRSRNCIKKNIYKNNKTGYKGVRRASRGNKFEACIGVDKKVIHLGTFSEPIDAALAYDKFIDENNTEHIKNFI
jgi:hypothetical protein